MKSGCLKYKSAFADLVTPVFTCTACVLTLQELLSWFVRNATSTFAYSVSKQTHVVFIKSVLRKLVVILAAAAGYLAEKLKMCSPPPAAAHLTTHCESFLLLILLWLSLNPHGVFVLFAVKIQRKICFFDELLWSVLIA